MRAYRSTLLTLGAAVVLPLLLFVVLQIAFSLQGQRRQIEEKSLARAREVTALVDGQLWADYSALSVLAKSQVLAEHDFDRAFERFKGIAAQRPRWANLIMTDALSGQQMWQTADPVRKVGPARPSVLAFVKSGGLAGPVAGMVKGPPPCPCLIMHAPVLEDGVMRYVLTIELTPRDFQNILMTGRPDYGVSAVVDRNGAFIGRTLNIKNKLAEPATAFVLKAINDGPSGLYRGKTWEGMDNYTAFQTSAFSGVSTHVAVDAGRLLLPGRGYIVLLAVGAVLTLALSASIGAFGLARLRELRREEERRRQSQKLEILGQLAGSVAHDFNNLLMVILGSLRKVSDTAHDAALSRPVNLALAAAERGKDLTSQLLAFTRMEPVKIEPVNIRDLLEGMKSLIVESIGPDITLITEIAPDAALVSTNATELELALLNLAVNARDAMPDGGLLKIVSRRSRTRNQIDIVVSDNGHGMSKAVQERALEPFYTTKPAGKGTGLGLAQVLGVVTKSGGAIEIDSREDVGTTVTLRLPSV